MADRDPIDALQERYDALVRELEATRERMKNLDAAREHEARLEGEILSVASKLGVMRERRALPLLNNLAIASPCNAAWSEMKGDDRVRFCGQCEKNVYNLSAMSGADAEAFLASRDGSMCVRLFKRADGTVITADCPVGVKKKRRRRLAFGVVGAGAMAFGALSFQKMGGVRPPPQIAPVTVTLPDIHSEGPVEEKMGDVGPIDDQEMQGSWSMGGPMTMALPPPPHPQARIQKTPPPAPVTLMGEAPVPPRRPLTK